MKYMFDRDKYSVQILVDGKFSGTGFCVLPSGFLLTCWHVIDLEQKQSIEQIHSHTIEVKTKTSEPPLKALFIDEWSNREQDIAVLKVEASDISVVPLNEDYKTGDAVYVFGFQRYHPEGGSYRGDPATGIIEGLAIKEIPTGKEQELIKVKDFDVSIGMSGAPLWNERTGCVAGIIVLSSHASKIGRAIPISVVFNRWANLKEQNAQGTRLRKLSHAISQLQNDKLDVKLKVQFAVEGLDEVLSSGELANTIDLDRGNITKLRGGLKTTLSLYEDASNESQKLLELVLNDNFTKTIGFLQNANDRLTKLSHEYLLHDDIAEIAELIKKSLPSRPYKFLNYFEETDAPIFFGRAEKSRKLLDNVLGYRMVLLYGKSGVGKSSIINAGLLSQLNKLPEIVNSRNKRNNDEHEALWHIISIRAFDQPLQKLKSAIVRKAGLAGLSTENSLQYLLNVLTTQAQKPLLIILDQFEEFFIRVASPFRKLFLDEISICYHDTNLPVKWLISMREDFIGELEEVKNAIGRDIFLNRIRLEKLNREQALIAMSKPAYLFGIKYEEGLLNEILDDLEREGVEPPQLQIICDRLYDSRKSGEKTISKELYYSLGKASKLLQNYLEQVLEDEFREENERRIIVSFFKELVTPEGTKRFRTVGDFAKSIELDYKEIHSIAKQLCDLRLLREFTSDGIKGYELTHEYLVEKINSWISSEESDIRLAKDILEKEFLTYKRLGIPSMELERFKIVNTQRSFLKTSEDENSFLLSVSIKHDYEINHWLQQNSQSRRAVELLINMLDNSNDDLRRKIIISLAQLPITSNEIERILQVIRHVGNPNVIEELRTLELKNLLRLPDFVSLAQQKVYERFWTPNEKMVYVPSGTFLMGSTKEEKQMRASLVPPTEIWASLIQTEREKGEVVLNEFWIDLYAVTNKEFAECFPTHKYNEDESNHPVRVTWDDANKYCQWLGKKFPTEEEWEKAARGKDGRSFPWGNTWDATKCNTKESERRMTVPVDSLPEGRSPYGCYNMAGNLWEWTSTDYDDGGHKVLKGGSVRTGQSLAYCSSRYKYVTYNLASVCGFRAAALTNPLKPSI